MTIEGTTVEFPKKAILKCFGIEDPDETEQLVPLFPGLLSCMEMFKGEELELVTSEDFYPILEFSIKFEIMRAVQHDHMRLIRLQKEDKNGKLDYYKTTQTCGRICAAL